MTSSYAVFFKTHFWDEFSKRQFERLKSRCASGDVYVVIDESIQSAAPVDYNKTIHIKAEDIADLRLAPVTTHGSIIWYNIDYPHYIAFSKLPAYDFYVTVEYDAIVNVDVDILVNNLARDKVDYLGFPIRKPVADWPWHEMHLDIYGPEMIVYLSCFAVFSHKAMTTLLERRQAMSIAFLAGELGFWPNNEAFIPNEVRNAGLKLDTLDRHGLTDNYDWWPPSEETELRSRQEGAFVHPVLAGSRFARSVVHHEPSLLSFFLPNSKMHQRLRQVNSGNLRPLLTAEIARRLHRRYERTLERFGLRPQWYANAVSGKANFEQNNSTHNAAN